MSVSDTRSSFSGIIALHTLTIFHNPCAKSS